MLAGLGCWRPYRNPRDVGGSAWGSWELWGKYGQAGRPGWALAALAADLLRRLREGQMQVSGGDKWGVVMGATGEEDKGTIDVTQGLPLATMLLLLM